MESEIAMKNLSQIAELRERISARNDIAINLPPERQLYSNPLLFGQNHEWDFDIEKYNSDSEYKKAIFDDMTEYNNRATIFNEELAKVYQFLVK